jgi:hypothetical protein
MEELMNILAGTGRAAGAVGEKALQAPATLVSEIARGPAVTNAIRKFGPQQGGAISKGVKKAGNWLDKLIAGGYDFPTDPRIPKTFTKHLGRTEPYKTMTSGKDIATPRVAEAYDQLPSGSAGRNLITGATRAFSRPSGDTWKAILGALGLGIPTAGSAGYGLAKTLVDYMGSQSAELLPPTYEEMQADEYDRIARARR